MKKLSRKKMVSSTDDYIEINGNKISVDEIVFIANKKGELKINSLVTVEIPLKANDPDSYRGQIPASAVYRTGLNSFVWLKTGTTKNGTGIFQLQKVTAGPVNNGMTTIISGISANQEVAEHAGSLTDSETFLNEN